ncbi:MAG: hypothetical protein HY680_08915 [Chloroflexi bacterium]|nr:hypothetical protein [Chloroflexota bacterium]
MAPLIGIVLGLLALGVVALPFLKRGHPLGGGDALEVLQERRKGIYRDIQVLHNDLNVGQVSQLEYQERLQAYRLQAALLLRDEDRFQELDQRLEEAVLALRQDPRGTLTVGEGPLCPSCGRPAREGLTECPSCGASLHRSLSSS